MDYRHLITLSPSTYRNQILRTYVYKNVENLELQVSRLNHANQIKASLWEAEDQASPG